MAKKRTATKVENRREKVVKAMNINPKAKRLEIAEMVGTNLAAVKRDLAALEGSFTGDNAEAFARFREQQLKVFELMEQSLVTNQIDPATATAWRGIRQSISDLLGLDAPSRSLNVNANIEGKLTPEYIEIARLMADVEPEDRHKVIGFIKTLVAPLVLEADCFPEVSE